MELECMNIHVYMYYMHVKMYVFIIYYIYEETKRIWIDLLHPVVTLFYYRKNGRPFEERAKKSWRIYRS